MEEDKMEKYIDKAIDKASGLADDIRTSHHEIKTELQSIVKRLDVANGYTAKHEQRLNTQDVFNAQITMTQAQLVESSKAVLTEIKDMSKKVEELGKFKNEAQGSLSTFKWLFGFLGIGTLLALIKLFQP